MSSVPVLRTAQKSSCMVGGDSKSSETDGPYESTTTTRSQLVRNQDVLELRPDKELEERVLSERSDYLASNLPADDVAPIMLSKNLLTFREHDEFKAMKRSGRLTMTSMSEYLLECLRKRQAGFLKTFCGILREIEPAKYLSDDIHRAYHEADRQGGFNRNSADRLSKLSISDPDLRSRPNTPQADNPLKACALCKKRKKRNQHVEKQLVELDKEYHRLKEAKIKVEGQLEILQDQLQQELAEKQNLKQIVPHLQDAISLIESSCKVSSSSGASGAQQTLNRISNLMQEQSSHERLPVLKRINLRSRISDPSQRDSILSMLSDTSSLAETPSDEEAIRLQGSDMASHFPSTERNRLSGDISKPVFSNLHTSARATPDPGKPDDSDNSESAKDHKVGVQESSPLVPEIQSSPIVATHKDRTGLPIRPHSRSESSPDVPLDGMGLTKHIRSHLKPRHSSESDNAMVGRSKNVQRPTRQITEDPDELAQILTKIRKKVDAESESVQQHFTHWSQ